VKVAETMLSGGAISCHRLANIVPLYTLYLR
jgi:hypothetical protein